MSLRPKIKLFLENINKVKWGVFVLLNVWFWFFLLPSPLFKDPNSSLLFAANNELLGATIAKDGQWRFPANDSIPQKFETCILTFEDAHFYHHLGINPVATFRALGLNIAKGKVVSGGSTITMQTIRLAKKNPPRTYLQKLIEMLQAFRLELSYHKKTILNLYVANAPFGGNVVGLEAASWRYYGKMPEQLSWGETATLAVLPNAPSLIFPGKNQEKLRTKRNKLLKKLLTNGDINADDYALALQEVLPQKPFSLPQLASHSLQFLTKKSKSGRYQSTLQIALQERLASIIENHHHGLAAQEIHNTGAMVVEVATGNVLAYIGNTNDAENANANAVDMVQAQRSSGSILKPFLYAKLLDAGKILPKMLLNDIPSDVTENFSKEYDGLVPADEALARSLNVPAIQMLNWYGVNAFHHDLNTLDFTTINQKASHYGLSLIVGGAEIKLWDLAQAYRNMAYKLLYPNEDFDQTMKLTKSDKTNSKPFDLTANAIFSTFESLRKVVRPESEMGWQLYNQPNIAWKTGTSHGFKDAWAVGLNPNYVVAIWVGNATGEGRPGIIGVKAAAPILFDVFSMLGTNTWFEMPQKSWNSIITCAKSGYKLGPNCEEASVTLATNLSENSPLCPYHQSIHLDQTKQFRVSSDCYDVALMQTQKVFVLPPIQAYYFKAKHPWFIDLPAMQNGCGQDQTQFMAMKYPRNLNKIVLTKDFLGKQQAVIFEVSHSNPNAKLSWYLDSQYVGQSLKSHKMPLLPSLGQHQLLISDQFGNFLKQSFEIE